MKRLMILLICLMCVALCLPAAGAESGVSYDGGYGETSVASATISQRTNIYLAAAAINGYEIRQGGRFSFNAVVGERTPEAGYQIAENGRGARVRGGGVSQVATTLRLAVVDFGWADIEAYTTYGDRFTGDYVDNGELAVVTDYAAGHDFAFTSRYPGTVTIEAWVANDVLCVALTGYDGSEGQYDISANGMTPMPTESDQITNVRLASAKIDGYTMSYGETFSFNGVVGPRVAEAGFVNATNGRGVRVMGGGVAQVASTIYLAAKQLDHITIDPVRTYGDNFTGGYVSNSDDAIVTDYNAGTDFSFTYYGSGSLVISLYDADGRLYCDLYELQEGGYYGAE